MILLYLILLLFFFLQFTGSSLTISSYYTNWRTTTVTTTHSNYSLTIYDQPNKNWIRRRHEHSLSKNTYISSLTLFSNYWVLNTFSFDVLDDSLFQRMKCRKSRLEINHKKFIYSEKATNLSKYHPLWIIWQERIPTWF